ncbi:flagellar motor switch protein FliM [Aminobacter aminovorans]|jgi:flagellar motor switch protein FliM|uniref:Flagellar motor switch protein FliM n=1 Tax=Aminobacter aminovorans TaxID=83263 RepID=A0A380WKA0_AMIAI|nr:FliM/FliN family flagellar motor switch protein [Aminobacter aminovorans]TCS28832.1 flagellar motor switch protein FliM [Aminobacter aminovorans]SUU88686.1 flagellar motor switch protein FliM [Aminobacter aminovorans]
MNTTASPAEPRDVVIERLLGDTGEPEKVLAAARRLAERAATAVAEAINQALPTSVFVEVGDIKLGRMTDAKAGKSNQAMTVAPTKLSPDGLVMTFDPQAVAILVNLMFGGEPTRDIAAIDRDLSSIELGVVSMLIQDVARAINAQGPDGGLGVKLPAPEAITGAMMKKHVFRDGPSARIVLTVSTTASRGTLTLTLPQRVLVSDRRPAEVETDAAPTAEWRSRFSDELMRSTVKLEASMPIGRMTLGELTGLEVGQVIELAENTQSNAVIAARGKTLFACEFGKLGQNYTVRIRRPFDTTEDTIEGIVAG